MQLRSRTPKPVKDTTPKYNTKLIIVNHLPSAISVGQTPETAKVAFVTGKLSDFKL